MKKLFTDHPSSVGETYVEHMGVATGTGLTLIGAGIACFIHGFLPFLFTTTAKDTIMRLHHRIVTHRVKPENRDKIALPAE